MTISLNPQHPYPFDFVPDSGKLPVEAGYYVPKTNSGHELLTVARIPDEEETDSDIEDEMVPEEIVETFEEAG